MKSRVYKIRICAALAAALFASTFMSKMATAQIDRTKPPVLGPPPSVTLPPIITRQLSNGLKLMIVEQNELPVADFILVVGTGGTANPLNKEGLADLTANMLKEGAGRRSSLDIADQEAFLGVSIGAGSGWDATTISLNTPTAQLDSALALFADVALRPAFPSTEFERVRKDRLTALIQLKDEGPAIANRAYANILYGAQHPYGRPLSGTEASVAALAAGDLQQFYNMYYHPNNSTLIIVGDVKADVIQAKINSLFGSWQPLEQPAFQMAQFQRAGTANIYLIDKPGAPQSSFRIGSIGVPRSTKDYFALDVLNTILGGSFTSRLNQNLRETKGYTYGAGSSFDMRKYEGPFTARAEIVAAKTDSALIEFMKELNAIRDTVPAAELAKAKRYLQLQLPSQFETTGDIAAALVPVAIFGLPLDYYNMYTNNIEQVTQADVQRAARQYINPAAVSIVIVGDRKVIEPGLAALKIAPISIRDIFGNSGVQQ